MDCLIMLLLIHNPYHPLNKIRILVEYTEHPNSNRDSDTKCDSDRHLHGKLTLPCNASALHGKVVIMAYDQQTPKFLTLLILNPESN